MDTQDTSQKPVVAGWQAELDAERIRIATRVLPLMAGVATVTCGFFILVYFLLGQPWQWAWMVFETAQAVVVFAIAYILARRGRMAPAVYLTVLSINVTAIIGPAVVEGMVLPGVAAGMMAVIFARLLAGRVENRVVTLISGAAMMTGIVLGGFQVFAVLPTPIGLQVLVAATTVVTVVFLTAVVLESRDRRYEDSLAQAEAATTALDAQRMVLEDRTRELARRTRYLEATAEVARDAASVLDLQELLSRVVALVSERFGFYHTGIFLLDPAGEWAILQAASSEGGQRMLVRGHRLRVGAEGIVGYVTGRDEPRIALDTGADAVFFDNPDLPATRSEMALPLRARGEIIGALDVQSTEPAAFTDEDVAVLQALADQVATAISNARLFQAAQEALEAERRAYGELGRQAWREMVRTRPGMGYQYSGGVVVPVEEMTGDRASPATESESLPALTVPVEYRGRAFGTIQAHKRAGAGEWTSEETVLIQALAEQLNLALESARLYQDTQRRAAREQLTGEITARMRETLDITTVLQTAAREMRDSFELSEVEVRLGTGSPSDEDSGSQADGRAGEARPSSGRG